MAVKKDILFRLAIVYGAFLLLGISIISRIVYIQFVKGDEYIAKAKEISIKNITVEPNRGDILATDGRLLATSIPYYEIRMDMRAKGLNKDTFYAKVDSLAMRIANLFGDRPKNMYKSDLLQAYRSGKRFHLVKRKVNYLQLKEMKRFPLIRKGQNKSGIVFIQENVRFQPHHSLASRTIGRLNKSGNMVGIEGSYDELLKGSEGIRYMQRLSGGAFMPISDENEIEPKDGYDVKTTIDVNLQDVAESALRQQLFLHGAHHGCVVLMEVETGEIKAITNLERDEKGLYQESFNYAIGEAAEPGSTFKLVSLMAAMEDGYINPDDIIDTGDGTMTIHGQTIRDHGDGYGKLTIQQIFEISSNVGVSKAIMMSYKGREKDFIDRIYSMKIQNKLGLDINGEASPYIKNTKSKSWSRVSMPWMAYGYELRLAPIHTLTFYNAVANNGKMVKPRFVKEISFHGKVIQKYEPEVIISSMCSRSTISKAKQILLGVVERGTAANIKNPYYKIAGKTGTAQIAKAKGGYKGGTGVSYQASFVGYFPADNPKYSCIVVINNPTQNSYYGNVVAGPVFRAIADRVFASNLSMQPVMQPVKTPLDAPTAKTGQKADLDFLFKKLKIDYYVNDCEDYQWITPSKNGVLVNYNKRDVQKYLVPNVVEMGLRDAIFLLENAGLKVIVKGRGKVIAQSISPGSRIAKGATIILDMNLG